MDPEDLVSILKQISTAELLCAAIACSGDVARVSLAEYAMRRGLFEFQIAVVRSKGKVSIEFVSPGVHAYDIKMHC
jgi:hypothetical protein